MYRKKHRVCYYPQFQTSTGGLGIYPLAGGGELLDFGLDFALLPFAPSSYMAECSFFKSQTLFLLGYLSLPFSFQKRFDSLTVCSFSNTMLLIQTGSAFLIIFPVRAGADSIMFTQGFLKPALGHSRHKWIHLKLSWIKITNQNIIHALRGSEGGYGGTDIKGKETVTRMIVGDLGLYRIIHL